MSKAYRAIREKQGLSKVSIDTAIRIIKTMVTKAFDNDVVDGYAINIFRNIKPLSKSYDNERDQTLTLKEYFAIIENAVAWFRPVIVAAMNTGMRAGEIQKVRWPMLDLEQNYFFLPEDLTKERREKKIPLNQTMIHLLRTFTKSDEHDNIFTNSKGAPYLDTSTFTLPFKHACEKAGVLYGRKHDSGKTFHDIRRTVKTNMVEAGMGY